MVLNLDHVSVSSKDGVGRVRGFFSRFLLFFSVHSLGGSCVLSLCVLLQLPPPLPPSHTYSEHQNEPVLLCLSVTSLHRPT